MPLQNQKQRRELQFLQEKHKDLMAYRSVEEEDLINSTSFTDKM